MCVCGGRGARASDATLAGVGSCFSCSQEFTMYQAQTEICRVLVTVDRGGGTLAIKPGLVFIFLSKDIFGMFESLRSGCCTGFN